MFVISGDMDKAKEFLLSDPDDKSNYMSVQMFKGNVVNPCMDSTYHFIEHVIAKLVEIHEDIQPLTTFHFGGDEVPDKALIDSPICQTFMGNHDNVANMQELKEYFVKHVAKIAAKYKLVLQGWEDGYYGGKTKPYARMSYPADQTDLVAHAWMNRWEWGRAHRAYEFANEGYKVGTQG